MLDVARATVPAALCFMLASAAPTAAPARAESAHGSEPVTLEQARSFVASAEMALLEEWIRNERAAWVKANFITSDTELIEAQAYARLMALTQRLAAEAALYRSLDLPADLERKLRRMRLSLPLAAPRDPALQEELAEISARLSSTYGRGRFCPGDGECKDLEELSAVLARSRDAGELLEAWSGWRTISRPMRDDYRRFVELGNAGARELGFADLGAMWRSGYDMVPDAFAAEVDRLYEQLRPLYESLHCYVRARLGESYGSDLVPEDGPIPAHLMGNMWAQSWTNIYDLLAPPDEDPGYDLTALLRGRGLDARGMVTIGEQFFTSLGFEPLPVTFWERSLFVKPRDREVVCHASAWNLDMIDDLRIKMCIEINEESFVTVHHELGHNFYQRAYSELDPLYRDSANDGFHEAVGDTVALSITPEYLQRIGLIDELPEADSDIGLLLQRALDKVAFIPFGMVIDGWRWRVFSGEIEPGEYNEGWWDLRLRYQGIAPPVARSESDFDPGAKYHVPANTPYARYFLATILQFQFHRALCEAAGFEGPLHRCSIYGSAEAGERLIRTLELGASRPWPEALEAMTGSRRMDAGAVIDYFAPLQRWLDARNRGRRCGW
jgi:peptidyl-dipeptidase A